MKSFKGYVRYLRLLVLFILSVLKFSFACATLLPEYPGISPECYNVVRVKQSDQQQSSGCKYQSFKLSNSLCLPSWDSLEEVSEEDPVHEEQLVKDDMKKIVTLSEIVRCWQVGDLASLKYVLKVFANNQDRYDECIAVISSVYKIRDVRKLQSSAVRCFVPIKTINHENKHNICSSSQVPSVECATRFLPQENYESLVVFKGLANQNVFQNMDDLVLKLNRDDIDSSMYFCLYSLNEMLSVMSRVGFVEPYSPILSVKFGDVLRAITLEEWRKQKYEERLAIVYNACLFDAFKTPLTVIASTMAERSEQTFKKLIQKLCNEISGKLILIKEENKQKNVGQVLSYSDNLLFELMLSQIDTIKKYQCWREYFCSKDGQKNTLLVLKKKENEAKLHWNDRAVMEKLIFPSLASVDKGRKMQFLMMLMAKVNHAFSEARKLEYCLNLSSLEPFSGDVVLADTDLAEVQSHQENTSSLFRSVQTTSNVGKIQKSNQAEGNTTTALCSNLINSNNVSLANSNANCNQIDVFEKFFFHRLLMPRLRGGASHHIGGACSNTIEDEAHIHIKPWLAINEEANILEIMAKATLAVEKDMHGSEGIGFFVYKLANEVIAQLLEKLDDTEDHNMFYSSLAKRAAFTKELMKGLINFFNWKLLVDGDFNNVFNGAETILRPQTCQEYIATLCNKVIYGEVSPLGMEIVQSARNAGISGDYDQSVVSGPWRDLVLNFLAQYWWELVGVMYAYREERSNMGIDMKCPTDQIKALVKKGIFIGNTKDFVGLGTEEERYRTCAENGNAAKNSIESIRKMLLIASHKYLASLFMGELSQPPIPINKHKLQMLKKKINANKMTHTFCSEEYFLDCSAYFMSDFIRAALCENYETISEENRYHNTMFPSKNIIPTNNKKRSFRVVGYYGDLKAWNMQVGYINLDDEVESFIRCREILENCWSEMSKQVDSYGGNIVHRILGFIAHLCKVDSFSKFRMRLGKAEPVVYIGKYLQHPLIAALAETVFNIPNEITYEQWRQCYAIANMMLNPLHSRLFGLYDSRLENLLCDIYTEDGAGTDDLENLFYMGRSDLEYLDAYSICQTNISLEVANGIKHKTPMWIDRIRKAKGFLAKDQLIGYLLANIYKAGGYSDSVKLADLIGIKWKLIDFKEVLKP